MGNILKMSDFVGAGFKRLDDNLLEQRPPRVKWGQLYRDMGTDAKIRYLERVASAMNHAAATIQDERNKLGELCEKKEAQLSALSKAVAQNNDMLQSEVTRMNADRQAMLAEIARLRRELKHAAQC